MILWFILHALHSRNSLLRAEPRVALDFLYILRPFGGVFLQEFTDQVSQDGVNLVSLGTTYHVQVRLSFYLNQISLDIFHLAKRLLTENLFEGHGLVALDVAEGRDANN